MSVHPVSVRVNVHPALPPLPSDARVHAVEPVDAEVWVRPDPVGRRPASVGTVGVAVDPDECVADVVVTPDQYAADPVDAVRRAHLRRLVARPRPADRLETWLHAILAVTAADGVAFFGATTRSAAGGLPIGTSTIEELTNPPPWIALEGSAGARLAGADGLIVVPLHRADGAGVLIAAVRTGGRAWSRAAWPELTACAAAMTASTQAARATLSESRLELVRSMLGVTVHDVRNALFGLELGTRLLARIPGADAIRTNLQGSVGHPLTQVRQTLSAVRAVLEPSAGVASAGSLDASWSRLVAETTRDRAAPSLEVAQGPPERATTTIPDPIVELVLRALVDNALDYGPKELPVRVRWTETPTGHQVEIRNAGRLPFGDLDRIEPFTHRAPRHVGLGLWLARAEAVRFHVPLSVTQDADEVVARAEFPSPAPGPE